MPANQPLTTPAVRADVFVSLVSVLDVSVVDPEAYARDANLVLASRYENYEIILVDNGLLPAAARSLIDSLDEIDCVRLLRLSRTSTRDVAILAGLDAAIGDLVVTSDGATDPLAVVPDVVDGLLAGRDIVQGVSVEPGRNAGIYGFGRRVFYWYNRRFLDTAIPTNATYLLGLSRRALNALTDVRRNHRYLRHMIRHIGYDLDDVPYLPAGSLRRREDGLFAGVRDAVEMTTSYSTHPLRMVTAVGVTGAVLNLLYALYVVVVNLVGDHVQEGWTSTSLQLALMFFVVCVMLAVQSEYIGRILSESRRDPSYYVMDEYDSTTLLADESRRNVSL